MRDGSTQAALPRFHKPAPPSSCAEVARWELVACELAVSQGTTICQAVSSEGCSSQGLQALGTNAPAWADVKGRATMDLSPSALLAAPSPKGMLPLAWSPSWPHNSRYGRRPLLQDLPKHPRNASGVSGTGTPLSASTPPHCCPWTSTQHKPRRCPGAPARGRGRRRAAEPPTTCASPEGRVSDQGKARDDHGLCF